MPWGSEWQSRRPRGDAQVMEKSLAEVEQRLIDEIVGEVVRFAEGAFSEEAIAARRLSEERQIAEALERERQIAEQERARIKQTVYCVKYTAK